MSRARECQRHSYRWCAVAIVWTDGRPEYIRYKVCGACRIVIM